MIRLIRSLYRLGSRLGDLSRSRIDEYCTVEITTSVPAFSHHETPISTPKSVERTSNDAPNRLFDNGKFLFEIKKKSFWSQFLSDLEAIGDQDLLQAGRQFERTVKRWHLQRLNKAGDVVRVLCVPEGEAPPPDVELQNMPNEPNVINVGTWLVPTFHGEPILTLPAAVAWWKEEFQTAIQDPVENHHSYDLVTGEPCSPNRLHRRLVGFAGRKSPKASLVSFDKSAYKYYGLESGANFPMSALTIYTYAEGGNYLLDQERSNSSVHVNDELTLAMWPSEAGITHPLIGRACALLGRWVKTEDARALWEQIDAVDSNDDSMLDVALFLSRDKGRVALLHYDTIAVNRLRDNLLRLRAEMYPFRSCRSFLETNVGGKSAPLLPKLKVADVLWAFIFGLPVYDSVIRDVLRPRSSSDKNAIQRVETCRSVWVRLHYNRKAGADPMPINPDVAADGVIAPPDIEECVRNLPRTKAALFGRLLYTFVAMKRVKHGFTNDKTVKPFQTLKSGMNSPGRWLGSRAVSTFQVYASEVQSKGWNIHRVFEAHWLEIYGLLGDWGPRNVTADMRREIAAGWYAEKRFADQHFDFIRARYRANKAATRETDK